MYSLAFVLLVTNSATTSAQSMVADMQQTRRIVADLPMYMHYSGDFRTYFSNYRTYPANTTGTVRVEMQNVIYNDRGTARPGHQLARVDENGFPFQDSQTSVTFIRSGKKFRLDTLTAYDISDDSGRGSAPTSELDIVYDGNDTRAMHIMTQADGKRSVSAKVFPGKRITIVHFRPEEAFSLRAAPETLQVESAPAGLPTRVITEVSGESGLRAQIDTRMANRITSATIQTVTGRVTTKRYAGVQMISSIPLPTEAQESEWYNGAPVRDRKYQSIEYKVLTPAEESSAFALRFPPEAILNGPDTALMLD